MLSTLSVFKLIFEHIPVSRRAQSDITAFKNFLAVSDAYSYYACFLIRKANYPVYKSKWSKSLATETDMIKPQCTLIPMLYKTITKLKNADFLRKYFSYY